MAVKQLLDDTLKTPMTRKEFLGQLGAVLLAVIGVTSILHALGGHKTIAGGTTQTSSASGYGSSAYGGNQS